MNSILRRVFYRMYPTSTPQWREQQQRRQISTNRCVPLSTVTRMNFSLRGACSLCHLKDVPCRRLGPPISTMLACADCTMTGRA